jgi:hypothetical protein
MKTSRLGSGRQARLGILFLGLALAPAFAGLNAAAETCITQSQMQPAERDALAAAAQQLAERIQANDSAAVQALTIAEFRSDFSGIAGVIASTAPQLKAGSLEVEQIYILDASKLTKTPGGGNPDAQFFCFLNQTQQEAEFSIPQLPPARYAFAMVKVNNAAPWRVSMLLEQEGGKWLLAGLYPKALMAAGHDGLWFWQQARAMQAAKDSWDAWLYFIEAQNLLRPAPFVASTHLDKLQSELGSAAPSAVSGLSTEQPLVVKAADGTEFRFTQFATDDAFGRQGIDVVAHLRVDALGDAETARKRNDAAAAALVAAHPELRKNFHGVTIVSDVQGQGQTPYATELAMVDIH